MKQNYTREERIAYWKRKIAYANKRILELESQATEMRSQKSFNLEIEEVVEKLLANGDLFQDWSERISRELREKRKRKGA